MLEIARAFEGRLLEALDHRLAFHLVVVEGGIEVMVPAQGIDQRDAVLHRQLRPRADGEVRRVRGVAKDDDVAPVPAFLPEGDEIHPEGSV